MLFSVIVQPFSGIGRRNEEEIKKEINEYISKKEEEQNLSKLDHIIKACNGDNYHNIPNMNEILVLLNGEFKQFAHESELEQPEHQEIGYEGGTSFDGYGTNNSVVYGHVPYRREEIEVEAREEIEEVSPSSGGHHEHGGGSSSHGGHQEGGSRRGSHGLLNFFCLGGCGRGD
uniref:Uncharacterized protein n=1 Tax=Meloidogyne hapla TaxID=6305 RepID=A0A1I8BP53_MELHA